MKRVWEKIREKLLAPNSQLWIVAALSLILSIPIIFVLRQTHVDVGLDVVQPQADAPFLIWNQNHLRHTQMQPIDERFILSKRFTVVSTSGDSQSLTLQAPNTVQALTLPDSVWTPHGNLFIAKESRRKKSLAWLGGPSEPGPVLFNSHAGAVQVWTWWKNEKIDFTLTQEERISLPRDEPSIHRYYAKVPRSGLSSIRLVGIEEPGERIARLYFGTLLPVVFTSNPSIPEQFVWGIGRENNQFYWDSPLRFPLAAQFDQGGWISFLFLFTLWFLLIMLVAWLWRAGRSLMALCTHFHLPHNSLSRFSLPLFLLFTLPPLFLWLFMLLCFYPGCMSPDSFYQWVQAHEMAFNTHHSIFSTFLIRVLTWIWDSPASVVLFQVLLMSALVGYGYSLLWRAGINRWLIGFFFLLTLLSPRNANYAIVIWKDIPYTINIAALTLFTMHIFLEPKIRQRVWAHIVLGLLLGLTPFFRQNGIVVYVGTVFLLFLFFQSERKLVFTSVLTSLALVFLIYFGLFSILHIYSGYSRSAYLITARISGLIYQDVPLSQEEYEFLNQVRSFEDRWLYQRTTSDHTIFDPKYDERFAVENMDRYQRFLLSVTFRYPYIMIRNLVESTSSFFIPFPAPTRELNVTTWAQLPPNSSGIEFQSVFPKLQQALISLISKSDRHPLRLLFWRPGHFFVLVLLSAAFLIYRTRDPRYLLIYAPVVLNTLSLIAGAVAQDVRYQFPLTFTAGFLLCLAFISVEKDRQN